MAFKFKNLTELPIRISICPDVRHRNSRAVVVVFSIKPIAGPVIKSNTLKKNQCWTLPDYGYDRPLRVVDKLALKMGLQRQDQSVIFRIEGLWN